MRWKHSLLFSALFSSFWEKVLKEFSNLKSWVCVPHVSQETRRFSSETQFLLVSPQDLPLKSFKDLWICGPFPLMTRSWADPSAVYHRRSVFRDIKHTNTFSLNSHSCWVTPASSFSFGRRSPLNEGFALSVETYLPSSVNRKGELIADATAEVGIVLGLERWSVGFFFHRTTRWRLLPQDKRILLWCLWVESNRKGPIICFRDQFCSHGCCWSHEDSGCWLVWLFYMVRFHLQPSLFCWF